MASVSIRANDNCKAAVDKIIADPGLIMSEPCGRSSWKNAI